jgi:hypothetical protein
VNEENIKTEKKVEAKLSYSMNKTKKLKNMEKAPVSLYDITGGQDNEEYGFGYLRSPYVISMI